MIKAALSMVFFLFSLFSFQCFAQYTYELDKTTRFDKLGVNDGLSSEYTTCIHQDKYGFIWIGTQFGLNLYDGYEVKVFNADPGNPLALYNGSINTIFEEPDGTMWFGTEGGISKYDRANHTFSNYIPDTMDLISIHNIVTKILMDEDNLWLNVRYGLFRFNKKTDVFRSFAKDTLNPAKGIHRTSTDYTFIDNSGVIWVSTSGALNNEFVLNKFNKATESFVFFRNDPSNSESFVGKEVKSMVEDQDGTIWVATSGGGLLEIIDKESGKFRRFLHLDNDKNSIISNNLNKVFEDAKGNIWIGGETGFSLLNKKTGKFTNFRIPVQTEDPNRPNIIWDIIEDYNGGLWLLSSGEGFFYFQPSLKKLTHYIYNPDNESSLNDNFIANVLVDQTDHLWVVTWNKGINRINPYTNSFRRIQKNPNYKNSVSSNYVGRIFGDSKGNIWVGCYLSGGLNRAKINNSKVYNHFEHYLFDADDINSISNNFIYSISEDKENTIWIGTRRGLNRYNSKDNSFTLYQHNPDDTSSISNNNVEAIFEDSHGVFWIGTRYGLNIMDRQSGKFIRFVPNNNLLASKVSQETRVIFEDSFGELWFGGDFLRRLSRKDTSFIPYFSDFTGLHDFKLRSVWDIVEDDSANLWLSTLSDGLFKFNRNDSSFTSITADMGLASNMTQAIEIDDKGFIWVSSSQGLSRINPHDYSIRNFDDADGLLSLEFLDRSSCKDKDGWLYFGTRNGINFFHPDSIKENKLIPPVYITSLTIAENQKYFDKPLFELSDIELKYNENDFSFDFVALNYINPQKNQYAYMLEGYDEEWIYAGNRRTAFYTNISPGEYTFRVKGSNNDGYWNEEGASLTVTILPPIWKTWWAKLLYVFSFFGLIFLLRRYEMNRLNLKQNLEIKQVESATLAELDNEKSKFFSNISHEFRTPLTLILGPLERLIRSPKDRNQKEQLNLVRRNAFRLQTLINQLLSLSKLESGKMKLRARPENIVKLSRLFLKSFHSLAKEKGIKLEFKSEAEEYIVYIDTIKLEKVANNLLSNAFKFSERGGKIKVSISLLSLSKKGETPTFTKMAGGMPQNGVVIKFSDTGMGIPKEELTHIFDRFYQVDEKQMKTNLGTGIGLALTKELIELHHGTITVESEYGMGTTFTIFLPTGKDHLSEDEFYEPINNSSDTDDDLLNDDYLFAGDMVSKTDLKTEIKTNSNLPLILVVEDNDDMRAYIKSYLLYDYNIIEAANGEKGAEKAIKYIPDLIVSDLMMPVVDGNEMTIQLKQDERTSHIPIILLTAKAGIESKIEGLETGADDFLTKPFDAQELLVRIKNLIEQRARLRKMLSKHIGDTDKTRIIQETAGTSMSKMEEQFLEKAKSILSKHLADANFTVELFATEMAMSRVQLHRKLKGLTDHSATEFIRDIRLNKAAELLKEGELNVTQISYEIGISSLSYFSKVFKEKFGVNPSEYS